MTELKRTKLWFKEAIPNPTEKTFQVQLGCHLEEVCEMLDSISPLETISKEDNDVVLDAYSSLLKLSELLKTSDEVLVGVQGGESAIEFLDATIDQHVTLCGLNYMMGYDEVAALKEVNDSNYSKFENGKAIFNENGKIAKGRDYFKPKLEKFVHKPKWKK